ncbi:hypothetical protein [Zobellia alginiliquefaciens]|uniref:hypothetical protein n=1 Tax=Zobellia alginiliquefaciens TaxID=3032586 RepID=UPI0023E3B9E6|nr:hypothetical protein [Zobellia alginiliquefaciens]
MRAVTVRVTNLTLGNAHITSYPYRPNRPSILYRVPLYRVSIEGKTSGNNSVIEDFEAIRFGVQRTTTEGPSIVGLADAQTHNLTWDYISTMDDDAWRVYDGFFIHQGPSNPISGGYGSIGCIEICGGGEWDRFNDTIKNLTGQNSLTQISNSQLLTAEYESATRPPLILV